MYHLTPTGINFKIFVRETNSKNSPEKANTNGKYFPVSSLTGNKAKEFYEEVLKDSSLTRERKHVKPKKEHKPSPELFQTKTFKRTDILWMAQNNDVKNMKMYFTQYKNDEVNIADEFGWTPLMCASCSGAENAVLLLLQNGADPGRTDKLGETALSLAQKKNQYKIVKILEDLKNKPHSVDNEEVTESSQSEIFFCSLCKETFDMNRNVHESSMVHLFNCPHKASTFYGIPESNKGFQLLLRDGWNKESGLGRDGTGRKFPIKVIMKKDRRGIGATTPECSVKREAQQLSESKRIRIYKNCREKDFEKNFRLEFS